MKILGILNITEDSFFDGGKYLDPAAAIAHAEALVREGADIVDIGAASSNPDARPVAAATEITRLSALAPTLMARGISLSIDSFASETQAWALLQGVSYLNDIRGFADPAIHPALAGSKAKLIVMHAVEGRASREAVAPEEIFDRATAFFDRRIATLEKVRIARDRLILDPGMGFFLGSDPETSFTMLRRLPDLAARYGLPLLVSVSRKSFLRQVTGRQPGEAGAASLAAELYAAAQGAAYIRTHAPGPLRDALKVQAALVPVTGPSDRPQ